MINMPDKSVVKSPKQPLKLICKLNEALGQEWVSRKVAAPQKLI